MMGRLLSLLIAAVLAFGLFAAAPVNAYAQGVDDFIASATAGGAAKSLASAAQEKTGFLARVAGFGKWVKKSGFLKKLKLDVLDEILEVGGALLAGDLVGATIEAAGGAAGLLVEYGIPMLAGATCSVFFTPAAGPVCATLARIAMKATNAGDYVEDSLEAALHERRRDDDDDDDDDRRRRERRDRDDDGGPTRVDRADITVNMDDMVTSARGPGGSAVADVGVVQGGDAKVRVSVDGTISTTTDRGDAYTAIGVVKGGRSQVMVNVDDGVTTQARGRSTATTEIGVANGGRVQVRVGDGVNTLASGSGSAETRIGDGTGSNVSVSVGGSVTTLGNRGASSSTNIGVGNSAFVKGDVLNKGGDLSVGGACRARRNGQCCIQIHRNLCVLKVVPTHKGHCPPRFERYGGLCYLYSDKRHRLEN